MEFSVGLILRLVFALYISRVFIKGYKVLKVASELNMLTDPLDFATYFLASVFFGIPVHFNSDADLKKAELIATVKTKGSILENIMHHYHVDSPSRHPVFVAEDSNEIAFQDRIMYQKWFAKKIGEKYHSHVVPLLQKMLWKWDEHTDGSLMRYIVESVTVSYNVLILDASPDCALDLEKIMAYMYNAHFKRWLGPFGQLIVVLPTFERYIPSGRAIREAREFLGAAIEPFLLEQKKMHSNGRRVLYSMWCEDTKRDKTHLDYEFSIFLATGIGANYVSATQNIYMMIFGMASCPEFQHKAYEELHAKTGGDPKNLSVELLFQVGHLDSFVKEILRSLCPINGQPRVYNGLEVNVNLHRIMHNPKHFDSPDQFIPDRFLDAEQPRNPAFVPFGIGPRACPAQGFVNMSYRTIIAILLLTYKIELRPESAHMKMKDLEIFVSVDSYWIGGKKWSELGKHIALMKRAPAAC